MSPLHLACMSHVENGIIGTILIERLLEAILGLASTAPGPILCCGSCCPSFPIASAVFPSCILSHILSASPQAKADPNAKAKPRKGSPFLMCLVCVSRSVT